MLTVEKIDPHNKTQVRCFLSLPFRLYANHPQWVPPLFDDIALMLNRASHPFYEHSDANFFIAARDGRDVGRIAALENRRFNDYHQTKQAQFYLFDCENDQEAANALFEQVFEWARSRGLNRLVGPKGDGLRLVLPEFRVVPLAGARPQDRRAGAKWGALNGAGILPEFQGHGGNALLYSEMEKTIHEFGFLHADLTQVAETAVNMRRDLENVGAKAYKDYRAYGRTLWSRHPERVLRQGSPGKPSRNS